MKGLKILRIKADLTQAELAKELNLSTRQICSYEQGYRNPKKETLIKLAEYFKCHIEDLY